MHGLPDHPRAAFSPTLLPAIVNAVVAPIRSTAIAIELFMIHALGDAPSPRIIGWISDKSSLRAGLSITLVSLIASGILIFAGARYAPEVDAAIV